MEAAMKFYVVVRKMDCCLLMETNSSECRSHLGCLLGVFAWVFLRISSSTPQISDYSDDAD